jgi:SlyX protein
MTDHDLSEQVEERFQVLENKVIHQEYTVDELNSVVTRQQDQIDALISEVKKMRSFIAEQTERLVESGEEPPPPHY